MTPSDENIIRRHLIVLFTIAILLTITASLTLHIFVCE